MTSSESADSAFVRDEVGKLLTFWESELRALVEIRCEHHGRDVPGPSFAVVLTSLAVLEAVLAIFDWDSSSRNMDRLVPDWIEQRSQLGDDYACRLWDSYRNGLAHLFAPKQPGGLVNVVRWADGNARPCIDGYRNAEFFQVAIRLRPQAGEPPGAFTMYAADLAKAVVDTLHEKRRILEAPGFDRNSVPPGWKAWLKQLRRAPR